MTRTQKLTKQQVHTFQKTVLNYYKKNQRSFPWRKRSNTPYEILVSEIMLQQTQADRVVPKYHAFLTAFPNFKQLSTAAFTAVIRHWQGLGYNRRALNLHKCAQHVTQEYAGRLPRTTEQLCALPGIGPYTAAAIQAFAFNMPAVVIETNIRTVYIHHFFEDQYNITDAQLLPLIKQTIDHTNPRQWYAALMDYGAHIKKTVGNKSRQSKKYTKQSTFKGSNREARGVIIKLLSQQNHTERKIVDTSGISQQRIQTALQQLLAERIIKKTNKTYSIID